MSLKQKILEIINKKYESKHWDFKQKWHDNNVDLVHDIICLANNETTSDSYIIFGIDDSGTVCGTTERKKLADIVDILRNSAKFFAHNIPEIDLFSFSHNGEQIDVLIILNTKNTPYYLSEDFQYNGSKLKSGHIYSRTNDRNTPKNKQADPYVIEMLWRKRFGIDLTVKDKLDHLLLETDNWQSFHGNEPKTALMNYENVVHIYFPEFRIEVAERDELPFTNYTCEGYCHYYQDPNVGKFPINIFYNSTKIREIQFMVVDGGRELILQPRISHFDFSDINKAVGYYYYFKNSTEWLLFGLISNNTFEVTSNRTRGMINNNGNWSVVFDDENDKNKFEEWARPKFKEEKKKQKEFSIAIPKPTDTIPAYNSHNMITIKALYNQYKSLNSPHSRN